VISFSGVDPTPPFPALVFMEEAWKVTYTSANVVGKFLEGLCQEELGVKKKS
jgi:hypothetical protein